LNTRTSIAIRVLVAIHCVVLLYFAHAAFIPVALALLFALVLSSPVEALHGNGLPRSLSAVLVLFTVVGVAGVALTLLWAPAQEWLAAAPRTVRTIEQKFRPTADVIHQIDAVTDRAGRLTDGGESGTGSPSRVTLVPAEAGGFLVETRAVMVAMVTVIILTLFLLAGGPPVLARMTAALASDAQATHILKVIGVVRSEVGRYYATIAGINLGLAVATALVMWGLGMPNPFLWGVVAGVLNFIPYVGPALTLVILTVVAFVTFDGVGRVFAVSVSYLGLATLEGQIVQPLLVGQRLELNPIIVFLALWFGGWLWGVAGIVIAVPALVALKVVAEHSENGSPLVAFLSPGRPKSFKTRRSSNRPKS
jgi:predicted PurR-regulated permease PerM